MTDRDGSDADIFRDFFVHAPVALHWQDEQGIIRKANSALDRLLDLAEPGAAGRNFFAFFDDPALAEVLRQRLAAGETLNSIEVVLRSQAGGVHHVLVSGSVLMRNGSFVHARVFTRDIPHVRKVVEALREANARKAAILDASLDAIITMDSAGNLLDFNPAAEAIFGYTREEAFGRRLSELIIPARLRSAHEEGLRRFLAAGEGPVLGRRIEIDALHSSGREFPVELSISLVRGAAPVFTATLRDITKRREAERELKAALQALRESEAALQEADRRKDEFIATLAHELRNPLAPVRTAAQVLGRVGNDEKRTRWAAEMIGRQVAVMARLLDDLLDTARVRLGKLELRKERVLVHDVLQLAIETARPLIDEKQQSLTLQFKADAALELDLDPVRFGQVVTNLLTNASKYSDRGAEIMLSTDVSDTEFVCEVADQGIGFRPEVAENIFALFSQLPEGTSRAQGGLGVGLALARALVQLHGGKLQASSAGPGRGSVFRVRLPMVADGRAADWRSAPAGESGR